MGDLDGPRHFDFAGVSRSDLDRLFDTSARYWRAAGGNPKEIYYSVLATERYRASLSRPEVEAFLELGSGEVSRIFAIFDRFWNGRGKPVSLDFGCGVGRLAVHAAPRSQHVVCADFSSGHLAECARNLESAGIGNFACVQLSDLSDFGDLPQIDLIYSIITLQHNTPPVMSFMVESLLSRLRSGGVAVLHIPIAAPDYHFDVDTYLGSPDAGSIMEMHILPRNNVNDIAERAGCPIVGSFSYGGTGSFYSEWIVFQKE